MPERTLNNRDEVIATEPVQLSPDDIVTIAEFPDPATANLARATLEEAGIRCFLQGENANSLLPIAFEARLQVRPEDEAAARAALNSIRPTTDADVLEAEEAAAAQTQRELL